LESGNRLNGALNGGNACYGGSTLPTPTRLIRCLVNASVVLRGHTLLDATHQFAPVATSLLVGCDVSIRSESRKPTDDLIDFHCATLRTRFLRGVVSLLIGEHLFKRVLTLVALIIVHWHGYLPFAFFSRVVGDSSLISFTNAIGIFSRLLHSSGPMVLSSAIWSSPL